MILRLPAVLAADQLAAVQDLLTHAEFIDGRLSAGKIAQGVKDNLEVRYDDQRLAELNQIVISALLAHPIFQEAIMPRHTATAFFACYNTGMGYGEHIDDPIMGPEDNRYRSDVSVTIFLNPPEDYSGGELVINSAGAEQYIKYPAGDAVVYPTIYRHRVNKITQGQRLVAVSWSQSMIRDPLQRDLLYQLQQARESLLSTAVDSEPAKQVDLAYVNLVKMWAEG